MPDGQVLQNPFKPTAGKMPPELIGRDEVVDEFYEGLLNGPGAPERLIRVSGVRGTGKTVMLGEFKRIALNMEQKWTVVSETASPGFSSRILEALSRSHAPVDATLQPTALGASLGSVRFERSSINLREAMMRATEKNRGLLITLDEVQDASFDETKALAIAVQHVIAEDRDVAFAFAGLPSMVSEIVNGDTLTFLRRAVPVELSMVPIGDVASSIEDTMRRIGRMEIDGRLVNRLATASAGYPFMVQLIGYQTWQAAFRRCGRRAGAVLPCDVEAGIEKARSRFDAMVIEPALQRVAPMELRYMLAMSLDEEKPSSTSAVAARMGSDLAGVSSYRARLMKAGLVESAGRGFVAFAIPYMDQYLRSRRDEIEQGMLV